ncbi:MAG: alpha-amylase family protein [Actinomycetota bacterium]|nr:alpha-amylase family protein [Actinomycetota bacterium]
MRLEATSDLWWKNAVIYCVDVETFADSNADGVGDFAGLTGQIDYLSGLGVTCIWLLPFYPSPRRDDGYDVTDYYGVDPRFGSLGDFVDFVRTAGDRGIRVIADMVINHTSDQHPWFQAARSDRNSPYHDYYVWQDAKPANDKEGIAFPDQESSVWAYDRKIKQWYLHHFYSFQPDLNISNPLVTAELQKIMGFWLQLGLSGFRLDAVPFFLGTDGVGNVTENPHEHLRRMRGFVNRRRGDAMLLGEVNEEERDLLEYFGGPEGGELQMLFNFTGMESMWLSVVRGDAGPLVHALRRLPTLDQSNQFAYFVRNHDELTLDKLTVSERAEVMDALAPEQGMRVYGHGIRRRVPPMLRGDQRRIENLYSLLFSMPGTPVILYGEEIGMGEDLRQPDRMSVRSPMQWSAESNAGFSTADPRRLVRPVLDEGEFGYRQVNVAEQRHQPTSLLTFFQRLIRARREAPEFGWGRWSVVDASAAGVLVHRCDWQEYTMLALHNLSGRAVTCRVELELASSDGVEDVFGDRRYPPLARERPSVRLGPYAYRWIRVRHAAEATNPPPPELT